MRDVRLALRLRRRRLPHMIAEITVWLTALAAVLGGTLTGFVAGVRYGRHRELERWTGYKVRRHSANERAIAEAKLLYEFGEIDEGELETRVGHLHDWDGTPGGS